jgi:hypothetical protein
MSLTSPVQLNVVIVQNAGGADGGTVTNSTVVIPIPAALQTLDSGNAIGQGVASGQTGFSSVDQLVRSIFRAGVFFVASTNTWYPVAVIQSISWS